MINASRVPEVACDVTSTASGLIEALAARHPRVGAHSQAVASLAIRMAQGLEAEEATVRVAAPVHDIGKLTVPRAILDKPGPLSASDWEVVRRHPAEGQRLLRSSFEGRTGVLAAVRSHHERWDGNGYPDGLVAGEIPLAARIIAVADAFQAMLESRPYRLGLPLGQALDELVAHSGTQFDPDCVSVLLTTLDD